MATQASILGLEGVHTWNAGVALNALDSAPGVPIWPRYRLRKIGGLHGLADAQDLRDPAMGRPGEIPRHSYRRGKTLSYEGTIEAQDLDDLRVAEAALSAAFYNLAEGAMVVTPVSPYGGPTRSYRARALDYECPEEQTRGPLSSLTGGFERPFALALRMSDSRYYATTPVAGDTTTPLATNLATNPKAGTNTTSWGGVSLVAGPTRITPLPVTFDTIGATTAIEAQTNAAADYTYHDVPVTNGQTYRFSVYVQLLSQTSAAGIRLAVYNAAGAVKKATGGTIIAAADGTIWTRLDVSVAADATATWRFGVEQSGAGTTTFRATGLMVEQSATLKGYFDGDEGGRWTGTAHASTSETSRVTLSNPDATAPSDPVIDIWGPVTQPKLRNATTGRQLVLDKLAPVGLAIASGEFVRVDFSSRRVLYKGVTDYAKYLNLLASDWWDPDIDGILPGSNEMQLGGSGGSFASPVHASTSFYPAFV